MGEPIAKYFVEQGFDLTGVDTSMNLIQKAKKRLPNAKFIVEDMRSITLDQKFSLIICWHSFFHLP